MRGSSSGVGRAQRVLLGIRSNPGVFARLRSFAFNILKANRRGSLPQDRFRAAIAGLAPLLKLLRVPER